MSDVTPAAPEDGASSPPAASDRGGSEVTGRAAARQRVTLVAGSMAGFMIGLDATVQGLAWQWVFWLNVPVGVVLVAAGGRVLAESRGPARRLDPAGLALATARCSRSPTGCCAAPPPTGVRGGAGPVLQWHGPAGGLVAEHRGKEPMPPLWLFANASLSGAVMTQPPRSVGEARRPPGCWRVTCRVCF